MKQEDVIRKVKALLARADADRNDNENERETALRQANALMDKFGIELLDLGDEDDLGPRGDSTIHAGSVKWKATLVGAVGSLYGCKVYRTTGATGQVHIIGRQHYRHVVVDISQWLIKSIEREAKRHSHEGRAFTNAFKLGAATAVYYTARKITRDREVKGRVESAASGTALVLVDHYAHELTLNAAWLRDACIRLGPGSGSRYTSQAGMAAGERYGSGLSLNGQLSGGNGNGRRMLR